MRGMRIPTAATAIFTVFTVSGFTAQAQGDFLSRYEARIGAGLGASGSPLSGAAGQGPGASSADAGGAPVPARRQDPLVTGVEATPLRIEGFNQSIDAIFPMTPEMIRRYREIHERNQRAILERPEPEARISTGLISLDPDQPPPNLQLAPGIATVIGFFDATGEPWPIQQFVVGAGQDFEAQRLGENASSLVLTPRVRIGWTNLIVLLQGADKPIVARLRVNEQVTDFRHDFQVMRMGPNARETTATPRRAADVTEAGSGVLLAALSGVDLPPGAREVPVTGVAARAWQIGDAIFLRSRHALLSPSWTASMSGPDGVRVYRIEGASTALFSVDGRIVRADLNLP